MHSRDEGGLSVLVGAILLGLALAWTAVCAQDVAGDRQVEADAAYRAAVDKTAGMASDANVQKLAAQHGMTVLNITWEDTGRYKDSAVGPNISDMTIQVQTKDAASGQYHLTCMPVIRFPNFEDRTADVTAEQFSLLVGNEKDGSLQRISLMEYLGNVRKYLNKPGSWKGDRTYLHASRDYHVLVSAQACFLPIPKQGLAEFNPVLFNYQSLPGDPAVLAIVATREGTSATVIDNQRDGFKTGGAWGQRLFFNQKGERAGFTGQRLSDSQADLGGQPSVAAAGQQGLNMVLLIQVPLKQKKPMRFQNAAAGGGGVAAESEFVPGSPAGDVENAVIGHGKIEGPFTEIDGLEIERDQDFPVRVTVQFYKATSNGVVSEKDMAEIAAQLQKVYDQGDYVGSLVTEGLTQRPTEYVGENVQPPDWWDEFWKRHREQTGYDRGEVVAELRKTNGADWVPRTEPELARAAEMMTYPENRWLLRNWLKVRGYWPGAVVVLGIGGGLFWWRRVRTLPGRA